MATKKTASHSLDSRDDESHILTVSQFGLIIKRSLAAMFEEGVWIEGEIEGFRSPNPHAYFTLVENTDDGKKAVLNTTIWESKIASIRRKMQNNGIDLKNGLKVRFFGQPDYYSPHGKLSFIVSDVDVQFSLGDIAKKREVLIKRLQDTGMDRRNKRHEVPLVPLRLGVVSSAEAAGWADARKHFVESGFGFSIQFCDVRVQGDAAPAMIARAIRLLGKRDDIDVVLVMRGGGSKSDLAAFDEEVMAMAIVNCPKPVFVGVGHEIDISVADIVAHTTCKTPTACADEVISYVADFVDSVHTLARSVRSHTQTALERARRTMSVSVEKVRSKSQAVLVAHSNHIELVDAKVKLLDPVSTMSRGWSITRDKNGNVVRSIADVAKGDIITTSVADGSITSTTTEVSQ